MGRRVMLGATLFAASAALAGSSAVLTQAPPAPLIVHEWGTFTSIAGADGQAVEWMPQSGPGDLPCFVERARCVKCNLYGTVRMETPVIYFYAPQPLDVSVDVTFNKGWITEWYPRASVGGSGAAGTVSWPGVHVLPGATDPFPREQGGSHYYAARETSADPIRVGEQPEKFLFYRGVGRFQPSISAIAQEDGGVEVRSRRDLPLGDVILFENRRGTMTFSRHSLAGSSARLPRPEIDDESGAPLAELEQILVAQGLYEPEARAMVNTWKDSWFEEGSRLLYIVSPVDVNGILPLKLSPRPSAITRVFVGRMELVTPATIRDVKTAAASGDRAVLAKYARFLQPIAERAGLGTSSAVSSATVVAVTAAASCR